MLQLKDFKKYWCLLQGSLNVLSQWTSSFNADVQPDWLNHQTFELSMVTLEIVPKFWTINGYVRAYAKAWSTYGCIRDCTNVFVTCKITFVSFRIFISWIWEWTIWVSWTGLKNCIVLSRIVAISVTDRKRICLHTPPQTRWFTVCCCCRVLCGPVPKMAHTTKHTGFL